MIYITGDIHCPIDVHKLNTREFPQQKNMTKKDYLIICGDVGLTWYYKTDKRIKEDLYWQKWFNSKKFTTLFIDGNHENFDILNNLEQVNMFGGKVGKVSDSIYHLKRGEIYTIEDKKFFCFGGAESIDKSKRIEKYDWWKEELPTQEELNYALANLKKHKNKVDYIISHCGSNKTQSKIQKYNSDILSNFFDNIEDIVKFKHWYFGHHHIDKIIDEKHTVLFNVIEKIK